MADFETILGKRNDDEDAKEKLYTYGAPTLHGPDIMLTLYTVTYVPLTKPSDFRVSFSFIETYPGSSDTHTGSFDHYRRNRRVESL